MIVLHEKPAPRNIEVNVIDFGGVLTPVTGGVSQRLNRLGNRFSIKFMMPPVQSSDLAQAYVGRLTRGVAEGARIGIPLGNVKPGIAGSPVTTSSGQTGTTLSLSGFSPNYPVKEGQLFNIVQGGHHYLYMAAIDAQADSSGNLSLPIYPPLRKASVAGANCEFETPVIEGNLSGDASRWSLSVEKFVSFEFTITESR